MVSFNESKPWAENQTYEANRFFFFKKKGGHAYVRVLGVSINSQDYVQYSGFQSSI